jgi:hypothetical protein
MFSTGLLFKGNKYTAKFPFQKAGAEFYRFSGKINSCLPPCAEGIRLLRRQGRRPDQRNKVQTFARAPAKSEKKLVRDASQKCVEKRPFAPSLSKEACRRASFQSVRPELVEG